MTAEFPLPPRFRVLEVLQADDVQVRLRVADEVLQRELVLELPGPARLAELDQGNQRARILREARMLAKVRHPGVQGILDVLEHAGVPILLLEPRHGCTLEDLLREQSRLPPAEVRRIGIQVAEAAQAVHAQGVVHRDLREANILVGADGSCVLTGFGFAKPQGSPFHGSSLNYGKRGGKEPGARLLPMYPAPEQLRGSAADARSDVYGLGCVLAHCLCGTTPKPEQVITAATLLQAAPQAPRRLVEVIAGCLAPAPSGRFPTMQAVAVALGNETTPSKSANRRALIAVAAVAAFTPLVWALANGSETRGRDAGGGPRGVAEPEQARARPWYKKPHALLIGIGYDGAPGGHKPLHNAERDATAIEAKLLALGWPRDNVKTLVGREATEQSIKEHFERFRDRTLINRDDQVFVYFAGHGEPYDSSSTNSTSGYLLPWDAGRRNEKGRSSDHWLHMDECERLLKEVVADHILIALDCCHVTVSPSGVRGNHGTLVGPGTYVSGRARLILGATDANQLASDGRAGGHSPFCEVFLDNLSLAPGEYRRAGAIHSALRDRCPAGQTPNAVPAEALNSKYEFVFGHYQ